MFRECLKCLYICQYKKTTKMKKQLDYQPWVKLNESQRKQVIIKLAKLSKDEGEAYLKKPGMKYVIDEAGNATGGYQDPYLLAGFF